ncbi:MAG TPA: alpha-L-rhamnosidase C-terminal domain-containing protein [Opitutaceae bacterium]|nr:alpha-L-rhamnosidase C-terminal domain-containing protein [Opitutaceae bacterium]HND60993.1 alpha-L-rhamnosidase C-terminal domain-containing protein [Opitutaceae bacterium]
MLFAPYAGEAVCRRVANPAARPGTPNMEPRHALDGAAWLWHPDLPINTPGCVLFRLGVKSPRAETVRLQVSGDLCFVLALDGAVIARGPDTGDVTHWSFATYELKLAAGNHRLEALVWWADIPQAPEGRMTWRGGFACAGLDGAAKRFTTGVAPWRVARLEGLEWGEKLNRSYHVIGSSGRVDLGRLDPRRARWVKPAVVRPKIEAHPCGLIASGWCLEPSGLPEQRHDQWRGGRVRGLLTRWTAALSVKFGAEPATEETAGWTRLLHEGQPLELGARRAVTVLIDTDDYLCGFPMFEFSGGRGAQVRIEWAESLFDREDPRIDNTPGPKGDRGAVAGKCFIGFGDTWKLGGAGRRWASSPWWRAGRYLLVSIKVGTQPLTLHTLAVERTGFPLAPAMTFAADDPTLAPVIELSERGLRACMHDVFVDCPYYEQMMYVADTRIQMLLAYTFAGDERLPRRGMELFDLCRNRRGYPTMRHPSFLRQESATFAMIWPWMLHDFALWRDDQAWLRRRVPGLRSLMEALQTETDADGLLTNPPGWLFMDWVPGWFAGWPPGQREGRRSGLVNLQYLLTLQRAADLESWVGDARMAQRWSEQAGRLGAALERILWDESRGLWADDESHATFSQHAQAFAVLAGLRVPDPARWADAAANGLAAATIYFQHYLFEALGRAGRGHLVLEKFAMWRGLVTQGFKTPVESPEPARSDCHAWGAHPVFHLHATIAGIRPTAPGFRAVRIAPQPGGLTKLESELPHPRGTIRFRARFTNGRVESTVELPPETNGVFVWAGREAALQSGVQTVRLG